VTAEAAASLLGTSPAILSMWEKRFGYPVAEHTHDGQRLYAEEMMLALRDALTRELSISAAISHVRRTPKEDT
jgi:DNA-binding transcriptional MerR regulator